ncbi:hypothetical protein J6W20_01600 [bacterium]|nr:hypothetical protein [bacterium]
MSDIKLALISSNLVNGKINTLGANKLNATIQVVFSGNTINLNATDFANTSFQIDFGTVNNQVFTSLGQNATGDASNNSS